MIGIKFDQAKGLFFDRAEVMRATSRAERRVLSRFGAFVRRSARSSIRKRKRISEPGNPPSSHTGLLRKFIFFAFDPNSQSVIIGPVRLNQKIGDAPAALEHGGTSRVLEGSRRRARRTRTIRVRRRPYMQPAFEREQPKLPQMWRDSIKRG